MIIWPYFHFVYEFDVTVLEADFIIYYNQKTKLIQLYTMHTRLDPVTASETQNLLANIRWKVALASLQVDLFEHACDESMKLSVI